jgi:hypothetical protein
MSWRLFKAASAAQTCENMQNLSQSHGTRSNVPQTKASPSLVGTAHHNALAAGTLQTHKNKGKVNLHLIKHQATRGSGGDAPLFLTAILDGSSQL